MQHEAVKPISTTSSEWIGTLPTKDLGAWIDNACLLMFGGIPWQVRSYYVTVRVSLLV